MKIYACLPVEFYRWSLVTPKGVGTCTVLYCLYCLYEKYSYLSEGRSLPGTYPVSV